MKTKLCLCALLLSQSVPASLIDFNDIPIGTEVSGLNPFGNAVVSTRFWLTEGSTTVAESSTRGIIDFAQVFGNDTPSVVMRAGPLDATQSDVRQVWHIDIAVAFQTPVTSFSADLFSHVYSTGVIYTGVDATGQTFTLGAPAVGHTQTRFAHVDIVAPAGGYLTGFHFSQAEPTGSILLAMDNLSYTVPETVGLPTFALAICGLLFAHRRMRAAQKESQQ